MWERGLKQHTGDYDQYQKESLPMWERGLKPLPALSVVCKDGRSPCGSVD